MTDNLKQAVATILEGFTLPADVRKILETAYWSEPAGSAEPSQIVDAAEMVDDRPGIVWKVTFLDGSSCHYGVKSTAQAAAGKCGTIEAIELKDKRFRLVEPAGSAEPKPAFSKFASLREYQEAMQAWRESAGSAGKVELPPLPEFGINTAAHYGPRIVGYTADQMHEYARTAMSTQSTRPADVSIKAGEIDLSDAEIIAAVESTLTAKLTVIDDEAAGKQIVDSGNVWVTQDVIDIVRALLAAKGVE